MKNLFGAFGLIALAVAALCTALYMKPPLPQRRPTQLAELERPRESAAILEIEPIRVPKGAQLDWQKMPEEAPCSNFAGCFYAPGVRNGVQLNAANQIVGVFFSQQESGKYPWMTLREPVPVRREDGMTILVYAYGWQEGFLLRINQSGDPEYARWNRGRTEGYGQN